MHTKNIDLRTLVPAMYETGFNADYICADTLETRFDGNDDRV